MYIEYTPIELFDEPDQHLQYPVEATTTIGFGIGGVGVGSGSGGSSSSRRSSIIALVENGAGGGGVGGGIGSINIGDDDFVEPKIPRVNRRCSEYTSATIKSRRSSSNQSYVNDGGGISGISNGDSGIPMGYDILARIRKLFGWSDNSEGLINRKRRAADGDWNGTSQFKYRKVESDFPKIITRSFEEDDLNIVPQRLQRAPLVMAQQKQQIQKEKKSSFLRPKTVTKHITNTAFADIEFSDDDDEEIIITNGRGESYNLVRQYSRTVMPRPAVVAKPATNLINIPLKQRQPPPPLIEARTGGILASTLMPDLHPIRQPTYSSVLSGCINRMDNAFVNGAVSKNSSSRERNVSIPRSSANIFNGSLAGQSSLRAARSIIAQEYQSKDREQYSELLQKLAPNLYGIKGTSPKPTSTVRVLPALNRTKPMVAPTIDLTAGDRKTSDENAIELSDDDVSEIIDLADDDAKILSACSKLQKDQAECSYDIKKKAAERKNQLPYVEPVNTLKEKFDLSPVCKDNWLQDFQRRWGKKHLEMKQELAETEKEVEERSAETRRKEKQIQERLKELQIVDPDLIVIDDFPEGDEEPEFPEITAEHEAVIKAALFNGPADQMLISKFNMNITRRDISTLLGKNWLNDEVINFYMNLLTERGEIRQNEGLPKVYAMNTFFVPKLQQSGHSGVRRWTRKVDIFAYDIIPVPVHVGGVHWCMAIIHLRARTIKYYDSMGTPNPRILAALEQYLRDESLDKRKRPFDTSDFLIESVRDVPRQNNGSDCGVFSCMFAEYITRDREITFSQQHMEYFRHRMILEIVQGKLMQ